MAAVDKAITEISQGEGTTHDKWQQKSVEGMQAYIERMGQE